jgi:hypothetical protein
MFIINDCRAYAVAGIPVFLRLAAAVKAAVDTEKPVRIENAGFGYRP